MPRTFDCVGEIASVGSIRVTAGGRRPVGGTHEVARRDVGLGLKDVLHGGEER